MNRTEEHISHFKDKTVEVTQSKQQKGKRKQTTKNKMNKKINNKASGLVET